MDLFLLLTALLCALTGSDRAAEVRAPSVEASCVMAAARIIAPAAARVVAPRPDGYVVPAVLTLDVDAPPVSTGRLVPERRRE